MSVRGIHHVGAIEDSYERCVCAEFDPDTDATITLRHQPRCGSAYAVSFSRYRTYASLLLDVLPQLDEWKNGNNHFTHGDAAAFWAYIKQVSGFDDSEGSEEGSEGSAR